MATICGIVCFLLVGFLFLYAVVLVAVIWDSCGTSQGLTSAERIHLIDQEARLMIDQSSESYLTQVERLFEIQLERR